ncbi:DUF1667 domain-containing protein [Acetonema longum]|uniref:Molybdopterin oxidoreductase n=1 Tax=Acetonema longum DSM 6540 TaxID=1009370 RepID=F7NP55_9FIRM|nr:DUF1667 domain-containing protein [Acetonema longum]EGO62178.1 hypothetical protein ALO_19482 [Acetonema longum DSM 6540]
MTQTTSSIIKRIPCIVCPISCVGEVEIIGGKVVATRGFTCPRGQAYGGTEAVHPQRTLTTTIRIKGGRLPLLPVVSTAPLPKEKLMECVRCLTGVQVTAPVREGDVVCKNILGLGVDVVASRDMA